MELIGTRSKLPHGPTRLNDPMQFSLHKEMLVDLHLSAISLGRVTEWFFAWLPFGLAWKAMSLIGLHCMLDPALLSLTDCRRQREQHEQHEQEYWHKHVLWRMCSFEVTSGCTSRSKQISPRESSPKRLSEVPMLLSVDILWCCECYWLWWDFKYEIVVFVQKRRKKKSIMSSVIVRPIILVCLLNSRPLKVIPW